MRLAWVALLLGGCSATAGPVPASLGVDPFYTRHVSASGVPILSSDRVSNEAMVAARAMARGMLAHRPDLARWLATNGWRIALIAEDEALLDLPENAGWEKPDAEDPRLTRCERIHYEERIGRFTPREYWNARARATGGKYMADGEEDVLGRPSSRYYGETIFVHEFAHQILYAVEAIDPVLYAEVEASYAAALAQGLWKDEYGSTTVQEYWAEGAQFWFNSNRLQVFDNRRILSDRDLAEYDPRLHAALAKVFGDNHRLASDPFYLSAARVPPGPIPANTAEQC